MSIGQNNTCHNQDSNMDYHDHKVGSLQLDDYSKHVQSFITSTETIIFK